MIKNIKMTNAKEELDYLLGEGNIFAEREKKSLIELDKNCKAIIESLRLKQKKVKMKIIKCPRCKSNYVIIVSHPKGKIKYWCGNCNYGWIKVKNET